MTTYPALVRYDHQAQDHAKRAALHREEALRLLQADNLAFPCQTEIPSADAAIQRIDKAVTMMGLTDPAVLLQQAQVCEASAKCIPVINQARQQLEQLQIEEGQAAITQARQQGCNVTGLENTLDYYRTIRDAAALLFNAKEQCKFQEGVAFAQKMPASIQNSPWIANFLNEVRAGLAAQQQVEQLVTKATVAADAANSLVLRNRYEESRKLFAQADGFIAQADPIAAPYPCLVERMNRYKGEYNRLKQSANNISGGQGAGTGGSDEKPTDEVPGALGAPVDKPQVEEIPDEAISTNPTTPAKAEEGGFWDTVKGKAAKEKERIANSAKGTKPPPTVEEIPDEAISEATEGGDILDKARKRGEKPVVEEIPDEAIARNTNPGGVGKPGDRRSRQPVVEEIPDDAVGATTASNRPPRGGNNPPPTIEEIPEEATATTSNSEKKPPKANKPPRTGPDKATRLGGLLRDILTGGNPPPVNNPPPGNPPAGNSGGLDLTGTWTVTVSCCNVQESTSIDTFRYEISAAGNRLWHVRETLTATSSTYKETIGRTKEYTLRVADEGSGRMRIFTSDWEGRPIEPTGTYSQAEFSVVYTDGTFRMSITGRRQ